MERVRKSILTRARNKMFSGHKIKGTLLIAGKGPQSRGNQGVDSLLTNLPN